MRKSDHVNEPWLVISRTPSHAGSETRSRLDACNVRSASKCLEPFCRRLIWYDAPSDEVVLTHTVVGFGNCTANFNRTFPSVKSCGRTVLPWTLNCCHTEPSPFSGAILSSRYKR